MKALITGIVGFSGKHLAELLKKEKIKVTGIDVNKGEYYQADLTDKKRLEKILNKEQPDYIFHLASPLIRSDQLVDETLIKNLEVDLFGSVNLLEAAAKLKQKPRMLITGTAAVYQAVGSKAIKETFKLSPITAYGLSKLTQELVCRKLAESYQLPLICTRTFLLIGPGQKPGFVVTDLIRKVVAGEAEIEVGKLSTRRDFTDVRDAVRAYWLLMQKGLAGEAYNVCLGRSYSIKEVLEKLQQLAKKPFKIKEKLKWRKNDPDMVIGNNQKIRKAVGWEPEITLDQSLKDTLNYWRQTTAKA